VRSTLPSRRIARLLFFVEGDRIGVVHGFIKKKAEDVGGRSGACPPSHEGYAGMRKKESSLGNGPRRFSHRAGHP